MKHFLLLGSFVFLSLTAMFAQQTFCLERGCTTPCPNDNVQWGDFGPLGCADASTADCDFVGSYATREMPATSYYNVDVTNNAVYQFAVFPETIDWRLTGYSGSTAVFDGDDNDNIGNEALIAWTSTFTGTLKVLVDIWSPGCGCAGWSTTSAVLFIREVGKTDNHWFGFQDDLWTEGQNWCRDAPPNTTDKAIIPNTDPWGGRYPKIRNGETGNCFELEIHSDDGANVTIETGGDLNVTK